MIKQQNSETIKKLKESLKPEAKSQHQHQHQMRLEKD
jgi:hypothetical protein